MHFLVLLPEAGKGHKIIRHRSTSAAWAMSIACRTSDFKVTARPAAVALGALTMAGRNNQDVMAR